MGEAGGQDTGARVKGLTAVPGSSQSRLVSGGCRGVGRAFVRLLRAGLGRDAQSWPGRPADTGHRALCSALSLFLTPEFVVSI